MSAAPSEPGPSGSAAIPAEVFARALALDPAQRRAFLVEQVPDSAELADLESLLGHYESAGADFMRPGPQLRIGPYRVLGPLGEGGFGIVYLAQQEEPLRRRVAIKVLKLGVDTEQVVARFSLERRALAAMDHPCVAKVLDAGATEQGRPYFVMELVRGIPITEYCSRHASKLEERIDLFRAVCGAIQHAHMKGILHRDLKPSNILVELCDGKPQPKVIDFGIAKALDTSSSGVTLYTERGRFIGTVEYASPEQVENSTLDIDTRADIYSLGVVLYQLVTGRLPIDAAVLRSTDQALVQRTVRDVRPPKPSTAARTAPEPPPWARQLRGELDWIILKAIEKDRTRRYSTAAELSADLERYLKGEPVNAGPPGAMYRIKCALHRHRVAAAAGAAVAAALLVGFGAAIYGLAAARAQRNEARTQAQTAAAVLDFVDHDLLGSADPRLMLGRDMTVRETLDRAAASVEHKFGGRPIVEAATRHTIGSLYRRLGRLQEARPQLERALSLRRGELGDEAPATLESMRALAILDDDQGRYDEAEDLFARLLAVRRRTLGQDHPDTITAEMDLGVLYDRRGRPADSERVYTAALESSRRSLGLQNAQTLLIQNNLAWSYQIQGRYDKARALAEPTVRDGERVLGADQPTVQHFRNTLGVILLRQGELAKAEAIHRQTLDARRRILGPEHPDTLSSIANLGRVLRAMGRTGEAIELLSGALEVQRRILGERHPDTVRTAAELKELSPGPGPSAPIGPSR